MVTPNMSLDLPVVGVTLSPTWATDLNAALTTIDLHDHTAGKGLQIPTAGLNIDADLSFQSNDALFVRSAQLINNVAVLPSGDVRAVYSTGNDLYWNNGSGTPVQITTGSSINTGALAINVWEYQAITTSTTIGAASTYVFLDVNTSAARTINLPSAALVTDGRYYVVKDGVGSASTNNITISPNGSDTIDDVASTRTIASNYGSLILVSNGIDGWLQIANLQSASGSVSGTIKLAGDLAGSGSTADIPRVGKINSASVPAAGALTTGNVLQVSGTSALTYGPVNVAGGANYITGVVPQANLPTQVGGDLQGDGSVNSALTVSHLTGVDGFITLGPVPATSGEGFRLSSPLVAIYAGMTCRDAGNTANVLVAGINATDVVHIGDSTHFTSYNGGHRIPVKTISSAGSYTVDTTTKDFIILCDSSVGAISIVLPTTEVGRVLKIKDIGGMAATNNITIGVGANSLEGIAANYIMDADFQCIEIIADSGNDWHIIGTV